MLRKLTLLAALLAMVWMFGCSSDGSSPIAGDPCENCDSIAVAWFVSLGDTLATLQDDDGDYHIDSFRAVDFSAIRDGFEEAIEGNASSGLAYLGLSLLELAEMNYDMDLWAAFDSLDTFLDFDDDPDSPSGPEDEDYFTPLRGRIMGNHFRILAESPVHLASQLRGVPGNLSVPFFQDLIVNSILPRVNAAIAHLADAEGVSDFDYTYEFMDDIVNIDEGELYFYGASLYALRAGLQILTAYNMDLYDEDGSYDWVETAGETQIYWEVIENGEITELHVDVLDPDAAIDALRVLRHQLTRSGSNFMTLRTTGDYSGQSMLAAAHDDLLTVLEKLDIMVTTIESENPGDQEHDVIRLSDLTDLNSDIQDCEDCPQFIQDWVTLHDVIDWAETFLNGAYTVNEVVDEQLVDLTVDMNAFFNSPVMDWKQKLPYHEWLEEEDYVEVDNVWGWDDPWNPLEPYELEHDGGTETFNGIDHIYWTRYSADVEGNPVTFFDAPSGGQPIDTDFVMPYFPDYTFGNVFPTMTRQRWESMWLEAQN